MYQFRLWHVVLGLAGLTIFASVHPSYAPLHDGIRRLGSYERDQATNSERERSRRDAEAKIAAERQAEADRKAIAEREAEERENRVRLERGEELKQYFLQVQRRLPTLETAHTAEARRQFESIRSKLRAISLERFSEHGFSPAAIRAKEPCSRINSGWFGIAPGHADWPSRAMLCLLGYIHDDQAQDEHYIVVMWMENADILSNFRQFLNVRTRFTTRHIEAMWLRRALLLSDPPLGGLGHVPAGQFDTLLRTSMPSLFATELIKGMSDAELRVLSPGVVERVNKYLSAASELVTVRDSYYSIPGVPPMLGE